MKRVLTITAIFCFVSLAGCDEVSNLIHGKAADTAKTKVVNATSNAATEVKQAVNAVRQRLTLDHPLKVGVSSFPPNIILTGDNPEGFDVDLWDSIAKMEGWEYEFVPYKEFGQLIPAVEAGDIDIAISGIFITEEREKVVDFSHQYKPAGLTIVINKHLVTPPVWKMLWQPEMIKAFGSFIVILFVFAFLIWQIEKRHPNANVKRFEDGVSLSFANKSTIGWGNFYPVTKLGLGLSVLMFFVGTIFVGDVISTMGAIKTRQVLDTNIRTPADLSNKTVATVADTTAVKALEDRGSIVVTRYDGKKITEVSQAFPLLRNGTVDAVVFDAPPIEYYLLNGGSKDFITVGGTFDDQEYGIAVQQGSELRELINRALLEMRKDGQYDEIHKKWFGE